jgi:hypothetical protein
LYSFPIPLPFHSLKRGVQKLTAWSTDGSDERGALTEEELSASNVDEYFRLVKLKEKYVDAVRSDSRVCNGSHACVTARAQVRPL